MKLSLVLLAFLTLCAAGAQVCGPGSPVAFLAGWPGRAGVPGLLGGRGRLPVVGDAVSEPGSPRKGASPAAGLVCSW